MADKIDKGKKRKRLDGSSKPSKRVATDHEKEKEVNISLHNADKWAPIIASTPGLAIPTSIPLKPYTKPRRNAPQRAGRSGDIASNELLLHSSEHHKLDYTAREEELGGSDALLKHYVGVFDPETGALQVMEARKMVVRGSVRAHQAALIEGNIKQNMRERRNDLGQVFGTKKSKKAIAAVTENAISPHLSQRANGGKLDASSKALLATLAETTANMATREELIASVDAAKPIPKPNFEATLPQDVYTIDTLVGTEIMKLIPVRQWEVAIKAKKEIVTSSRFVANRVIQAAHHGTEKLKLLRYMLFLFEFLNATIPRTRGGGRQLKKREDIKSILGDMPEAVFEGAKRKFSDGGLMTRFQVDLISTHLCALALVVDNFEVDTWDLKEDLKMESTVVNAYFKELGARIAAFSVREGAKSGMDKAATAQRKMAKLKIPLEFPRTSFRK